MGIWDRLTSERRVRPYQRQAEHRGRIRAQKARDARHSEADLQVARKVWKEVHGRRVLVTLCPPRRASGYNEQSQGRISNQSRPSHDPESVRRQAKRSRRGTRSSKKRPPA